MSFYSAEYDELITLSKEKTEAYLCYVYHNKRRNRYLVRFRSTLGQKMYFHVTLEDAQKREQEIHKLMTGCPKLMKGVHIHERKKSTQKKSDVCESQSVHPSNDYEQVLDE
jgi:Cu/Zn superoxide dismutase